MSDDTALGGVRKAGVTVHVAKAHKREGIPDCGRGAACERKDCPGPEGWEQGFGLAGGGFGVYEFCGVCQTIRSKTEIDE